VQAESATVQDVLVNLESLMTEESSAEVAQAAPQQDSGGDAWLQQFADAPAPANATTHAPASVAPTSAQSVAVAEKPVESKPQEADVSGSYMSQFSQSAPKKKSKAGIVVAVLALVVLIPAGYFGYLHFSGDDDDNVVGSGGTGEVTAITTSATGVSTTEPMATTPPTTTPPTTTDTPTTESPESTHQDLTPTERDELLAFLSLTYTVSTSDFCGLRNHRKVLSFERRQSR
jgi:hypothetical protein